LQHEEEHNEGAAWENVGEGSFEIQGEAYTSAEWSHELTSEEQKDLVFPPGCWPDGFSYNPDGWLCFAFGHNTPPFGAESITANRRFTHQSLSII